MSTRVRRAEPRAGFDQYRGIYLKRIPTYSFPLMLEVMEEHGTPGEHVLKNTGLDASTVARDGTLVSFLQALKLVRNILKHSPRSDIGLLIGSRYQLSTYGVLGYAMMSCATWADALRLGSRYYQVASSLVALELEVDRQRNRLSYIATPFYPDLGDIEPFTVEKLFASLVAVTRPLMNEPAYPCAVSLAFPSPPHAAACEETFQCPVEFGADRNRFELDMAVLEQPLAAANEVCAEMGRKMCEQYLQRYDSADDSLQRQVADLLLASPGSMPGMEVVANALHMSSRTLRRLLLDEGTSFQQVSDDVRHDLSKHYLRTSGLNLEEIAHLVGFTESTNFRRAFKRWSGMPPARYRRQALAAATG